MTDKTMLLALFPDIDPAASAVEELRKIGVSDEHVNIISGIPVTEAMLGRPKQTTNVPLLALGGAVAGFLLGIFLAFWTPDSYPLITGNQALVSGPPTIVVLFEMTMLGMLVSTFLGVFLDSRFPSYEPKEYVAEISDGKIAILIECQPDEEDGIEAAMTRLGAESVKRGGIHFMSFYQRLMVVIAAAALLLGVLMILSMDIIKIDWVSFMEIQPSFKPMKDPLPVASHSIPIEGAAYIPGQGAPSNPVPADAASVERGRILYSVTCVPCHGAKADGNGIIGGAIVFHPADLTSDSVQNKPDGSLFLTISNGIQDANSGQIHMPALNENLTVRDRWDVVNYIRTLKATATATPTPKP